MSDEQFNDAVLDAALAELLAFGWRNLTMAGIARRARISRTTLYRRFDDTNAVLRRLLEREFRTVIVDVAPPDGEAVTAAQFADELVTVVRRMREHPLYNRVLETEPEALLTYLTSRLGTTQNFGIAMIGAIIQAGQAAGTMREGDPRSMAFALVIMVQSFWLSGGIAAADGIPEEAALQELTHMLRCSLEPDPPVGAERLAHQRSGLG